MKFISAVLSIIFIVTAPAGAELIINEVMANEPGSDVSLEWVELYNDSIGALPLDGYQLAFSTVTIDLPSAIVLPAGGYYIVCRQLFGDGSSPGFESRWGDSSGVWGDDQFEATLLEPFEASFTLRNTDGSVVVLKNSSGVSALFWSVSGSDGYSWERVYIDSTRVEQSVAHSGSTPGKINSVTPVPQDLSLDSMFVEVSDDGPLYTFHLTNRGTGTFINGELFVNTVSRHTVFPPVRTASLPAIDPDEQIVVTEIIHLNGLYIDMLAYLDPDLRPDNDTLLFTGIGNEYPPIKISEFLPNPTGSLLGEWVEIINSSGTVVDLSEWYIGDELNRYRISETSVQLFLDNYALLSQNGPNFLAYYPEVTASVLEPNQWPTLNNDGDIVRLVDQHGIVADWFAYTEAFDNNHTWSKSELSVSILWGESLQPGGSPGEENALSVEAAGTSLRVTPDPTHFSPDGDGYQDQTTIAISAPNAESYSIKIYDRYGRKVKTLFDEVDMLPFEVIWDGYDDNNRRLPIGIYIIYAEADGVESIKQPVVIAR